MIEKICKNCKWWQKSWIGFWKCENIVVNKQLSIRTQDNEPPYLNHFIKFSGKFGCINWEAGKESGVRSQNEEGEDNG